MQNDSKSLIEAEKLNEKLLKTKCRLSRLNSGVDALNQNLLDLIDLLVKLQTKFTNIQNEQLALFDLINNLDSTNLDIIKTVENRLTNLVVNEWNELELLANKIFAIPGIENKHFVDNIVKIFKLFFLILISNKFFYRCIILKVD